MFYVDANLQQLYNSQPPPISFVPVAWPIFNMFPFFLSCCCLTLISTNPNSTSFALTSAHQSEYEYFVIHRAFREFVHQIARQTYLTSPSSTGATCANTIKLTKAFPPSSPWVVVQPLPPPRPHLSLPSFSGIFGR